MIRWPWSLLCRFSHQSRDYQYFAPDFSRYDSRKWQFSDSSTWLSREVHHMVPKIPIYFDYCSFQTGDRLCLMWFRVWQGDFDRQFLHGVIIAVPIYEFSWARSAIVHGIYYISYWFEFASLQLCAKTTQIWRKSQIRARWKFIWPFLLSPKGCQLLPPYLMNTLRRQGGMYAINIV